MDGSQCLQVGTSKKLTRSLPSCPDLLMTNDHARASAGSSRDSVPPSLPDAISMTTDQSINNNNSNNASDQSSTSASAA
ncbi:hypothetical protein T4B_14716 [Trichinella pseudospiralis]|uniref:Uncharacterized protein n=1 Tax=Trichinella pseudospiralis TaxID=6337 RepID=A0A0V1K3P9_TRIPS|nr:hypothetical protein T4B_14716 [Trichinella pseudospiralis]KRZ41865.1 hypothetical protein T4C_2612 [Trichinella pseudospiralis]